MRGNQNFLIMLHKKQDLIQKKDTAQVEIIFYTSSKNRNKCFERFRSKKIRYFHKRNMKSSFIFHLYF